MRDNSGQGDSQNNNRNPTLRDHEGKRPRDVQEEDPATGSAAEKIERGKDDDPNPLAPPININAGS